MDDRPDLEPTQEVENALRKLFRQSDPDPAFVADLERRLLARRPRQSRWDAWQDRLQNLRQGFSSWASIAAWGAAALLLVLGLAWTLNRAMPRLELGSAQTPPAAASSPTAAPIASPSSRAGSGSNSSEALVTSSGSGQAAGPPGTGEPGRSPLPQDTGLPSISATELAGQGKLAYLRGGNIWVQDLSRGQSQRLTSGGGHSRPRWSPSGNFLAFQKGSNQVWVWRADGRGSQALNGGGPVSAFAWSPARDWLAYVAGNGELRLADGSGQDLRVLIRQSGSKAIPRLAWSPAGDWIAFQWVRTRPEGQPPEVSLWKVSTDGAGPLQLYAPPSSSSAGAGGALTSSYPLLAGWTGDGRSLLFWAGDETFSASLLADGLPLASLPASGGDPQLLAEAVLVHEDFIRPDPSGSARVALVVGGSRETWTGKVLSVFAGRDRALVTSPESAASSPAWSPDGTRLAYTAGPDAGQVSGEEARQALLQRRIWVRDFSSGGYDQLTTDPDYRDEAPLWSADGETLLFARMDAEGRASLWLVPAAGGGPQPVVEALDAPAGGPGDPWFGYYGHLDWGKVFDWWRE